MGNAFRLHSKYNPQKEADNFVSSIKGLPLFIVITEPGESYLASSFRNRFPCAKLLAIRYTRDMFLESDCLFDAVWRGKPSGITFFLINNIPDEYFSRTVFLSWSPSDNIWKEMSNIVWQEIKVATKTFLSIIGTRTFFGHMWAKNIFRNLVFSKHVKRLELDSIEDAVFLTSGYSLERFIQDAEVKNYLRNSFILCASSTFSSLRYSGIMPNLVLGTDGGFWAGEHIKRAYEGFHVFPLEAKLPRSILENANLAFLSYGSLIENLFFESLGMPYLKAERNGTVSGTAVSLLLDNIKGNIFISGLDLSFSNGFTHARPNENIQNNLCSESRTQSLATILATTTLSTSSLKTYASWFLALPENKKKRLFRIGKLGVEIEGIQRITSSDFVRMCKKTNCFQFYKNIETIANRNERKEIVFSFFDKIIEKLKEGTFFDGFMDVKALSIEKEICQLIAFSDYIALIGEKNTNNCFFQKRIEENVKKFIKAEKNVLLER